MELALLVEPADIDLLAVSVLIEVAREARVRPLLGEQVIALARRALRERLALRKGQRLLDGSLAFRGGTHDPFTNFAIARFSMRQSFPTRSAPSTLPVLIRR